jgi:glucose-6-phosphate 1-dehydrogenase
MIPTLLVIGATGDLASRLLLPALAQLVERHAFPADFGLVGAARSDWTEERFRSHVRESISTGGQAVAHLGDTATFRPLDVTDAEAVRTVVTGAAQTGPVGVYIALPTALVEPTIHALGGVDLPAGSRIAVEKPFGHDVESARRLNTLLLRAAGAPGEAAVYRVDHALGMTSVRNLLTLRLTNRLISETWNHQDIDQIDVLWDETLGLQGRASYFDRAGTVRDVMQNHMTQVLCMAAMEPPASLAPQDVSAAKLDLLRHTRVVGHSEGHYLARRARYSAGILADGGGADGSPVPRYVDEPGVDPHRDTETLAEVLLEVDTPRWRGTRFVMRAGKALASRRKGILVHYRRPDGEPVSDEFTGVQDRLWIGVDGPNEIRLGLMGSTLGPPTENQPLIMAAPVPPADLPPYGYVLADFLSGGHAHSVIGDEPVEAWRIYEPVLDEWTDDETPLATYPAGSDVPTPEPP